MKFIFSRMLPTTFLGMIMLFIYACSDEPSAGKSDNTFEILEKEWVQDFTQEAQSVYIPVQTDLSAEQWTAVSGQAWCRVEKEFTYQQTLCLSVEASGETDVRTATVTIKSPINNYAIEVRQLGYGPAILVKKEKLSVPAAGGALEITVTANIEYQEAKSPDCDWIAESPSTRGFVEYVSAYRVEENPGYQPRSCKFVYTGTGEDNEVTATCTVIQAAKSSSVSDVTVEGDVKVVPIDGHDSEHQPGCGIEKSFDGIIGKGPYHSIWQQSAAFPVMLEYIFDGKEDIDYFIYHTRRGNGNFGEFDLYVALNGSEEYVFYASYDFKKQDADSKVVFEQTLPKVAKMKFMVKSGFGNFVSCDEMEFFRKKGLSEDPLLRQLLTVFKDGTCSELREDVTLSKINSLPGYFALVATSLLDGSYDAWERDFRIRDYRPYSDVVEWAERLMTKKYGNLDNPTGVCVEAGDSLIVLVGDTHGQLVQLRCVGEETVSASDGQYVQTSVSGESRFLKEGVNKVAFTKPGMLFVMYTANLQSPNAQPIRIHIPPGSGKVSGFFDVAEHKTNEKYQELIGKATYKYFSVRGEKIIFYFHREEMKRAVPYDILSAIRLWDDIIGWQQELMGIEEVRPSQVNNHVFAISPEGSYMWASDYRIGFVNTYLENILLKDRVMAAKDNAWGPAHEIGHIHQKAINWSGSTESSNNLFSNYVIYKLGKYGSRGRELSYLAESRLVNRQAWYNMGTSTHQNEDTELHMRMNWQLWNYYHRCGYKKDFFPTLFKLLRANRITESNPGEGQLLFAKMACKAADEDLTEFFEMWGFLEPVDEVTIEQYGTWKYKVTENMIKDAKAYMASFPKKAKPFYYLEDRRQTDFDIGKYRVGDVGHYTQFRDRTKITKKVTTRVSGRNVRIMDGEEAVAFEWRSDGKLLYFSNFFEFDVPASVSLEDAHLYAVQEDGKRIEVGVEK